MGYLDKNSDSHGKIPLESWKWQKRWFVLSEAKSKLYYFKDPDELPQYRGVIDMTSCVVEDLEKEQARSNHVFSTLGGGRGNGSQGGREFSLLICLSSTEPGKPILKSHEKVILRAETAALKYEWLARLRQAVTKPGAAKPRRASLTSSFMAKPAPGGSNNQVRRL